MWKPIPFVLAILSSGTAWGLNLDTQTVTSPVYVTAKIPGSNHALTKSVTLLKVHLSEPELSQIQGSFTSKQNLSDHQSNNIEQASLPRRIDLGMNKVPVLDQGQHGSCVTFTNTAAIDALLGKGDYVSQLCSLELGSYLASQSDLPSGWEGSYGPWIFDQINRFGIISKKVQASGACAGIKEYPPNDPNNEGKPMSTQDYHQKSEAISESIYKLDIMNAFASAGHIGDKQQGKQALQKVKEFLAQGSRVSFGTLLILVPSCHAGACASYHEQDDTWAITADLNNSKLDDIAGHEMLIIGYDDNAIAIDHQGQKHQGLLILRNSWGPEVGDQGNFYMTYDYFETLADEAQAIDMTKE